MLMIGDIIKFTGLHVAPYWTDASLLSPWLKSTHSKNLLTGASYDYIPEEINANKSIKRLGFLVLQHPRLSSFFMLRLFDVSVAYMYVHLVWFPKEGKSF